MNLHRARVTCVAALATSLLSGFGVLTGPAAQAASTGIVISELMFHPASDLDEDDYLELTNVGTTAVDLSGWSFSSGITLTLPPNTSLAPGGHLVVAKDVAQFQTSYGFTPAAAYEGNLSNSGETISLQDAQGTAIDSVSYLDADPWPRTPDGNGPSVELIDATLDNDDPLNWAAATDPRGHSAGTDNSVRRTGLGPRVTAVTTSPTTLPANRPLTVTASIAGQTTAVVRYRRDFGAERTKPMSANGDGTFSANIAGAAPGHLIRYRVEASNPVATTRSPRVDDTIDYRGVVVPHGIDSAIPVFEWFVADADYHAMVSNPQDPATRPAVLAYDGVVVDNGTVNVKGHKSRSAPKLSWNLETPPGYDLAMPGLLADPVDKIHLQADWSDRSHGRAILSWEAYQRAGVVNHQMFPVRSQRNGRFLGEYSLQETPDGTWRDREGYADHQYFEAETSAFSTRPADVQFSKKTPDDGDFGPIRSFIDGVRSAGAAQRSYLSSNADLPQMINYAAVTAIVEHHDSSSKNFDLARDPDSGRWSILPWDLDHTLGNGCCRVDSRFVTPAEPGDNTNALMRALLANPEWRDMYFRRLRTLVDDILAAGRMESLYDARIGPARSVAELDFAAWPYPGSPNNFDVHRKRLFAKIAARRSAFAEDNRVPRAQPSAPTIVVAEIQHSPSGGAEGEFVELYNPGSVAIDLSGWSLGGAVDLTIQPGTVIRPRSSMTLVADDPAFRATYGDTIFVGDRFSGELGSQERINLVRADGSNADTVSYGGAGWPLPTSGQSLELVDPSADNNDPANWVLSQGQGTPGTPSGG